MTTARDVENEILERAGLTPEAAKELGPMVSKMQDGAGRVWEWNRPHPGNPSMMVHSMFKTDVEDGFAPGDIHIYAFPTSQNEVLPFARYVVNKNTSGYVSESMNDEVFMDEIAAEMSALALERGVLEECPNEECEELVLSDSEKCPECGTALNEEEEEKPPTADTLPVPPEGPQVV